MRIRLPSHTQYQQLFNQRYSLRLTAMTIPTAAIKADNNNLRRWRKTCAIMTKGLTASNALHHTIPVDQTSFVSERRSTFNSYERPSKLISGLWLFTEQILTAISFLQSCHCHKPCFSLLTI